MVSDSAFAYTFRYIVKKYSFFFLFKYMLYTKMVSSLLAESCFGGYRRFVTCCVPADMRDYINAAPRQMEPQQHNELLKQHLQVGGQTCFYYLKNFQWSLCV